MSAFAMIPDILRRFDRAVDFTSAEITVMVGPTRKCFYVHEALVRKRSAYFDAALDCKWREGRCHVIEMIEDDEDAFNIYMNWLYRNKIYLDMPETSKSAEELDDAWTLLFRSYALGDKLFDSQFKDALTDTAAMCFPRMSLPSVEAFHILYEITPPESPMRLLITSELAQQQDILNAIDENWPHALTVDLVKLFKFRNEYSTQPTYTTASYCEFHEHKVRGSKVAGCYRAVGRDPRLVMQYMHLDGHDAINFATRSIRFSSNMSQTTFKINERLLRKCQPALDFSLDLRTSSVLALKVDSDDYAFNIYLNWLCSGRVYIDFFRKEYDDDAEFRVWTAVAHAYELGGRMTDSSFRDAICDAVALSFSQDRSDNLVWVPSCDSMHYIFELFDAESGLCKLLAYQMASAKNRADEMSDQWPEELLHAVANVVAQKLVTDDLYTILRNAHRCTFHEHGTAECYRKQMPYCA